MKKTLITLITGLFLLISAIFVGCDRETSSVPEIHGSRLKVLSADYYYRTELVVLCDTETGVCYLLVKSQYSNQPVAITLLVDPDGKPLLKT